MRRDQKPTTALLGLVILVSLSLTGCLSLAVDITPPPVNTRSEDLPSTSIPTLQPTREIPTTEVPQSGESSGEGVVNVFILDQTGGLLLKDGLDVILEGYDSFELVYQDSLPASSADHIQFTGVPFPAGRVYFVSIYYGGAVYRSDIIQIAVDQNQLDLEVVIFDTTTDQAGLVIDRVHILFDFIQPDLAQVVEIYIISNMGNSTVVSESQGGINVEFPLPSEASGVEFEDGNLGQRYLKTDAGFGDTVSIPPGSGIYPVSVSYLLPYQKDRLDFSQRFDFPVGAIIVMTPVGVVKVKGSSLEDLGQQSIPSGAVQVYSGPTLARGDSVQFRLSGNPFEDPSLPAPQLQSSQLIIFGAGGLGLLILVSGVWLYIRNQHQNRDLESEQGSVETREGILDSIIALDDLFADRELSEKVYQQKRAQLKRKLQSLPED